jgi:hypothetical protein
MKLFVAIDDTDNIDSRGTGELAEMLSRSIGDHNWGRGGRVTRHQMLVHPDIPYTSHNSAMCFPAEISSGKLNAFKDFAMDFLADESAPGSDPGLCIVNLDTLSANTELMRFGRRAQAVVLSKDDAYQLARRLQVHLSEHGGTGQGVIGALAGTGLRLTGNDGRFKGHFKIDSPDGTVTVNSLKRQSGVDAVHILDGPPLQDSERVCLGKKIKAILLGGLAIITVSPLEKGMDSTAAWQTCSKQQLRKF